MAWSDWAKVGDDGTIPEGLLPASKWQYKWMIHHSFDLGGGGFLERGQGTITMVWRTRFGAHQLLDTAKFSFTCQADPLDPGFGAAMYTYWLGSGITVREEGTATQGGDEIGQLVFSAQGPTWAEGVSEGFFYGELLGDIWDGEIAAGETVEFKKWYPNLYIPKGKQLWIRTLAGEAPVMQTILDPPTHDKHEFWLDGKTLLTRRQLNRTHGHDGLQVGGAITARSAQQGGGFDVGAGYVILHRRERAFEAATLAAGAVGKVTVASLLGQLVVLTQVQEPYLYPHTVLGRIAAGGVITQTSEQRGTIIADWVTEFSAWIEDDGKIMVNMKAAGAWRQMVSKDRGESWATA